MGTIKEVSTEQLDGLLKGLLILTRAVDHILETSVVEFAAEEPLSASKVQVIRALGYRSAQTSTWIAHFLGVSKPAVSQIIDAMERSELVQRKTAAKDRREVLISLSRRGRATFHNIRKTQRHLLRAAVRIADADIDRWTKILTELCTGITNADSTFQSHCLQCGAHADTSCVLVGGDADCPVLSPAGDENGGKRRVRVRKRPR